MIYRLILALRHLAYDKGWKKSLKAPVPTICLGNITVGGTGKTPHTELVLRKLLENGRQHLAVLSRGYKRMSRGFQLAGPDATARLVGDEPLQIARKFPQVTVAVNKNRIHGCQLLASGINTPGEDTFSGAKTKADAPENVSISGGSLVPEAIILDDAFQYRRLNATLNIVLVDYNRPVFRDKLLPWGRLRDLPSQLSRAQVVIVTKCPAELHDWDRQEWRRLLRLSPAQQLFFTTITYGTPEPVFPEADMRYTYSHRLVLVSGIANNAPLRSYLSDTYRIEQRLEFGDHHKFTRGNLRGISAAVKANPTACLMTTEKDAQRLRDCKKLPDSVRARLFYIPIQATFLSDEDETAFTQTLLGVL